MDVRQQPDAPPPALLTRQSSVYSLTLEEFQSTMGGFDKDLGSMNMDEFLKNIWTAEESQAMASPLDAPDGAAGGAQSGLHRQGSLTLPRTLSQKTVDEVWRDFNSESAGRVCGYELQQQQRQPTIGEMTLEEFLVRAGVVREEINHYRDSSASGNTNSGLAAGFAQVGCSNVGIMTNSIDGNSRSNFAMSATSNVCPRGMTVGMIPGVASVSAANQISSDGLTKGDEDLSSLSPVPYLFDKGLRGKKRSGAVEKVVERRQRRMIKNRESAARSRARKQAYTMELEAEVAKLKDQNQALQKKLAIMIEMQKNQALEMLNQQGESKKSCLRRTQTGPW